MSTACHNLIVASHMVYGQWREAQFEEECRAFVLAVSQEAVSKGQREQRELLDWTFAEEDCCLRHAPVYQAPRRAADSNVSASAYDVDEENSFITGECSLIEDGEALFCQDHTETLVWNFSVVFSPTWQCPVLYFTVSKSSGELLDRSEVLAELKSNLFQRFEENSWDFLSYDEHPVDGHPACFLHPCQTVARLSILIKSSEKILVVGEKLLAWMALTLTAVEFPVSSDVFVSLRTILRDAALASK